MTQIKSESRNHKDDEEDNDDEIPEQPELRGEKPIITASLTDDSERATMLGELSICCDTVSFCRKIFISHLLYAFLIKLLNGFFNLSMLVSY